MSSVRPFERFLGSVHRRYVVTRGVERAGVGLLGGCAVAGPLLGVALWRGLPLGMLAVAAMGVGVLAGVVWGAVWRPTRLASAMEADRQLGWPDLLASAYAVRHSTDPWMAAVMLDADAHCRASSPSAVLLNRLGARAWGGIGLATALVCVLAFIPTVASTSEAGDGVTPPATNANTRPTAPPQFPARFSRRTAAQAEPEEAGRDTADEQPADSKNQDPKTASPGAAEPRTPHADSTGDPAGHGAGQSRTPDSHNQDLDAAPQATHGSGSSADAHETSAGGRQTANAKPGHAPPAAGAVGDDPAVKQSSPDHFGAPADPKPGGAQLRTADQVPDAYRDVVRSYFEGS